jgi:hypothetical protein
MPRQAASPFEKALSSHDRILDRKPIGRTAFLNAIRNLDETGSAMIAREELGVVKFATAMHGVLSQAIETQTEPPLTEEQKQSFAGKLSGFELLMTANGEGGTPAPTDTQAIPTAKAKG